MADPASVARWADGVLVVSQAGVSTRDASKKAAQLLEKVGARTIGVVVWGLEEGKGVTGYNYGGHYYYASYYNLPPSTRSGKVKTGDNGALATGMPAAPWVPEVSPGRRFAAAVGRILTGVLAFLVVIAIAGVVVYLLAQYLGWDLSPYLSVFSQFGW